VTARTRLTILYTGLVLAAGVLMTGITYVLMGHNLSIVTVRLPNSTPPPLPPDLRRMTPAEFLGTSVGRGDRGRGLVDVADRGPRAPRPIRTITATARRCPART
jgi:hypothetical protein